MPLEGSAKTMGQTLTSGNPLQQHHRPLTTDPSGQSRLARRFSLLTTTNAPLHRQNGSGV